MSEIEPPTHDDNPPKSGVLEGTKPPGGGRSRTRVPGSRKEDWIGNQLRRVYSEVAEEAIPQQMMDLLNALDDSDPKDGESK